MKTFYQFLTEMENDVPLGDIKSEEDSEILIKIARLAIKNHHDALLKFYEELADKDADIKFELDQYRQDPSVNHPRRTKRPDDVDEIQPSMSDMGAKETDDY